jgi:hypothetical protein
MSQTGDDPDVQDSAKLDAQRLVNISCFFWQFLWPLDHPCDLVLESLFEPDEWTAGFLKEHLEDVMDSLEKQVGMTIPDLFAPFARLRESEFVVGGTAYASAHEASWLLAHKAIGLLRRATRMDPQSFESAYRCLIEESQMLRGAMEFERIKLEDRASAAIVEKAALSNELTDGKSLSPADTADTRSGHEKKTAKKNRIMQDWHWVCIREFANERKQGNQESREMFVKRWVNEHREEYQRQGVDLSPSGMDRILGANKSRWENLLRADTKRTRAS